MDEDYIKRKKATDIVERLRDKCGNDEMTFALNWANRLLKEIPAEDAEKRKHGTWVRDENNGLDYCSECGSVAPAENLYGETIFDAPYCYICGAQMHKVQ